MSGHILGCGGGGAGSVREFLTDDVEFVSTHPWLQASFAISDARLAAYSSLSRSLNFIGLRPNFCYLSQSHLIGCTCGSMLDQVQVVDVALA